MSFSSPPTYAELKTAVTNWSKRGDLSSYLDDIILMGEKYLFRRVRTRAMETSLNLTIASGVAAIPTDYVAMKYAYIDGSPTQPLQMKSAQWIQLNYPERSSSGKPVFMSADAGSFIFGPYPDSGYTVKGIYFKRLTSVASTANDLFTSNPDLYLFAALAELEPFLKNDKRVALWSAKREQLIADINKENDESLYSGGPLSMSVA